jgi:DNA-directed RNA polymerase specialized sigma24 family protein
MPQKIAEAQQKPETNDALIASLDRIARSLAVLAVYSSPYKDKPDTKRIPFLAALGFEKGDIAAILDTTPGTVQKQLSLTRKGQRVKKSPPKKATENAADQPGIA